MIIAGKKYPSIGFIRAKAIIERPGRWALSIFPTEISGMLPVIEEPGAKPHYVSWAEAEVDSEEVERISRCAPHLIPGVAYHHRPSLLGLNPPRYVKLEGLERENRHRTSPSMQTVISAQKS